MKQQLIQSRSLNDACGKFRTTQLQKRSISRDKEVLHLGLQIDIPKINLGVLGQMQWRDVSHFKNSDVKKYRFIDLLNSSKSQITVKFHCHFLLSFLLTLKSLRLMFPVSFNFCLHLQAQHCQQSSHTDMKPCS